ncbi:MAG: hypothetical protein BBJ60_09620 [Desulfobacterales bacterium S7086C20]|nr:MAG: hypothetical protein BBJ60_09620 [Desulfobacterales bacterium S7086C20]
MAPHLDGQASNCPPRKQGKTAGTAMRLCAIFEAKLWFGLDHAVNSLNECLKRLFPVRIIAFLGLMKP